MTYLICHSKNVKTVVRKRTKKYISATSTFLLFKTMQNVFKSSFTTEQSHPCYFQIQWTIKFRLLLLKLGGTKSRGGLGLTRGSGGWNRVKRGEEGRIKNKGWILKNYSNFGYYVERIKFKKGNISFM